uniref:Uncharacterized protein n=1 Tax=Tetranychus urticae TaxID=32264 RepID=T1KYL0_TETUR
MDKASSSRSSGSGYGDSDTSWLNSQLSSLNGTPQDERFTYVWKSLTSSGDNQKGSSSTSSSSSCFGRS